MAYRDIRQPTNGYPPGGGSESSSGDGPSFVVEHLATFTVSAQNAVVYPADGMRRLLQMEKASGIWTQKMMLRLDRAWVTILDYENGEVVERFPLNLIHEPTAFTSKDPKDLYNNIFIFVVGEDPVHRDPPEMHIFQCVGVSSELVVEDLKMYMAGNYRPGAGSAAAAAAAAATRIPPPPNKPPPEPPMNGANNGGFVRMTHEDAASTTSEHYEKDVTVLNRCFDDIERFIARLQHAAAARRELERRRKSRKSKKKEQGDGMLSMRARPPSDAEYIDIFQKFKLSFNLLAKLKSHIHDPNAPELVHFLFSPLTLIVEASHESAAVPNLPARVIAPLLSHDAIELLSNCLSSKETELWHSLGDAWHTPKDKWNSYVIPYVPTFMDGWTPDASFFPEEKEDKRPNTEMTRYSSEFYGYDSDRGGDRRSRSPPSDFGPRSDISNDSIEKNGDPAAHFERQQRRWLAELKARNAKIVQVTYPRTANNDKELTVVRGEYLEVLDNSRKWWKARNMRGQTAHVPHTIVTLLLHDDDVFTPPPSADWRGGKGKNKGDSSESLSEDDDGLPTRRKRKESVTSIPPPPPPMPAKEENKPVKPQPQSVPVVPPAKPKNSTLTRSASNQDLVVEELKDVLEIFHSRRNKLDIRKTPAAFISTESTPQEVQEWLKAKEFDIVIQKRLNGMSGEQLFKLKRPELEKYCGKEEGSRLDSQLTLQRKQAGYQTVRSSELLIALKKAREKAEQQSKNGTIKPVKKASPPSTVNKSPEVAPIADYFNFDDSSSNASSITAPKSAPPKPPTPFDNKNKNASKPTSANQSNNKKSYDNYDSDDDVPVPSGTLRDRIRKQKRKMASTSNSYDD